MPVEPAPESRIGPASSSDLTPGLLDNPQKNQNPVEQLTTVTLPRPGVPEIAPAQFSSPLTRERRRSCSEATERLKVVLYGCDDFELSSRAKKLMKVCMPCLVYAVVK